MWVPARLLPGTPGGGLWNVPTGSDLVMWRTCPDDRDLYLWHEPWIN